MSDIYELSIIRHRNDMSSLRESITCDRETALIWLRATADELEEGPISAEERPEHAACRRRAEDELIQRAERWTRSGSVPLDQFEIRPPAPS